MILNSDFNPKLGAQNLLVEAMEVSSGDSIVIVTEDVEAGVYDSLATKCIEQEARRMGLEVDVITVSAKANLEDLPNPVISKMMNVDAVLFQSGLGDRLRFSKIEGMPNVTVSYALDVGVLGGHACTVSHQFLRSIQRVYEQKTSKAKEWHVTCPLGTDIRGTQIDDATGTSEAPDFTVTRFPLCAPRPVSCSTANGVVAVARCLISTSNHLYDDDVVMLDEPLMVTLEAGQIVDVQGNRQSREKFLNHYQRVGSLFSMKNPMQINSWHAGMNPGLYYPYDAELNPDRWGKVVFANPRFLHFHTCGDADPGEISWSLIDASASFDDEFYWQDGQFRFLEHPECKALMPDGNNLKVFTDIGVGH